MRIVCISSRDSLFDVIGRTRKKLMAEIANSQVEVQYVPSRLDIPAAVLKVRDADLIFVFAGYEELNPEVQTLMEGLVKADMENPIPILKGVEEVVPSADPKEQEEREEILSEKWKQAVIEYLFHPEKMIPRQGDSEEE